MREILKKLKIDFEKIIGFKPSGLVETLLNVFSSRLHAFQIKTDNMFKQSLVKTADKEFLYLHTGELLPYYLSKKANGSGFFILDFDKNIDKIQGPFSFSNENYIIDIQDVNIIKEVLEGNIKYQNDKYIIELDENNFNIFKDFIESKNKIEIEFQRNVKENVLKTIKVKKQMLHIENGVPVFKDVEVPETVTEEQIKIKIEKILTNDYEIKDNQITLNLDLIYDNIIENSLKINYLKSEILQIESKEGGYKYNLKEGFLFDIKTVFENFKSFKHSGIKGGEDEEDLEKYRNRVIDFLFKSNAPFSEDHIRNHIKKTCPFVKEVWINPNEDDYYEDKTNIIYLNDKYNDSTIEELNAHSNIIKEWVNEIRPVDIAPSQIIINPAKIEKLEITIKDIVIESKNKYFLQTEDYRKYLSLLQSNILDYFEKLRLQDNFNNEKCSGIIYNTFLEDFEIKKFTIALRNNITPNHGLLLLSKIDLTIKNTGENIKWTRV